MLNWAAEEAEEASKATEKLVRATAKVFGAKPHLYDMGGEDSDVGYRSEDSRRAISATLADCAGAERVSALNFWLEIEREANGSERSRELEQLMEGLDLVQIDEDFISPELAASASQRQRSKAKTTATSRKAVTSASDPLSALLEGAEVEALYEPA